MRSIDISALVRNNVQRLKPYSSARDEFQGEASVFLDANENPNDTNYNRYPDPHQVALKKRIAEIKHVNPDQIFLGNGSDEAIDLLIRGFCKPGVDNVLIPEPTYGMYSISAAINDVDIKKSKLTPDFDLDTDVLGSTLDMNTKLIFICSPNNPTGNRLSVEKIKALLKIFNGLVVVDEAYIDFTETDSFTTLLDEFNNLVVMQTLSKAWGLAGIRLGMCFADPLIIDVINKIKPPYNISTLTQQVALEQLAKEDQKNKWVQEIKAQRKILLQELNCIRIVRKVFPTDANFVLARVDAARTVYEHLVSKGIIVRDRSNVILCEDCLRITVGTEKENKILIKALQAL